MNRKTLAKIIIFSFITLGATLLRTSASYATCDSKCDNCTDESGNDRVVCLDTKACGSSKTFQSKDFQQGCTIKKNLANNCYSTSKTTQQQYECIKKINDKPEYGWYDETKIVEISTGTAGCNSSCSNCTGAIQTICNANLKCKSTKTEDKKLCKSFTDKDCFNKQTTAEKAKCIADISDQFEKESPGGSGGTGGTGGSGGGSSGGGSGNGTDTCAGISNTAEQANCYANLAKGSSDASLMSTLQQIMNTVLGFVGFIATAMIVYGGILYATSAGDSSRTKRAKDTIIYGAVGLIIALLALGIVNFVLANIR